MTTTPSTQAAATPVPASDTRADSKTGFSAIVELTKPRITRLVVITSGVGFTLGALGQHWQAGDLAARAILCILGTALSASGANALNQWWERERDALMPRTCARPLPQSRVTPRTALIWGLIFSLLGVSLLFFLGTGPAFVSLATILIYVLVYTPLKPLTTLNTIVGAIPGALPPLIGWSAAATGNQLLASGSGLSSLKDPGAWSLVLLMVIWQIPHVLALAWMYRDDYALGGYRMLPILDPSGRTTARTILIWSAVFIPVAIAPCWLMPDRLSIAYGIIAAAMGIWFLWLGIRLARGRERVDARRVFIASIIHLPVLLMAMVADALLGLWIRR